MAGQIKGITIEIGGNTVKLQEALKQAKKATGSLNNELKSINRLLKINPNSITALTQKQDVLNEKISTTKEKLQALKQAREKALSDNSINKSSKEYRDLERQIEEATNSLKRFEAQQREVVRQSSRLGQISTKLEGISNKAHAVADKFRKISFATGILLGGSLKIGADFEKGMSKVSAISGATAEDLEKLKNKARQMGAQTEFSANQSAEAMNYMAMAGWKTKDMLEGLDGVMDLASASGEDLAVVSDIITDGLTAFGLKAKESGRFADVLAVASSSANTNVTMMGETFKYVAPVAGALGFSIEDTAEAIGLMANMGIKSSQAGTSLRNIMNNLSKDFVITGKELGNVTIHTTNADGSMRSLRDILADTRQAFNKLTEAERAQASEALVGKNAMAGFLALMNSSPQDIKKLERAIDGANGTAKKMAETMRDNLYGDITKLKSSLEELALSLGEGLRPTIRIVAKALKGFTDVLSAMPKGFKTFIASGMLATASIYPLGKLVGYTTGTFGKMAKIMSFASGKINITSDKLGVLGKVLNKIPRSPLILAGVAGLGVGIALINDVINKLNRVKKEIQAIEDVGKKKISGIESNALVNERYLNRLKELEKIEGKSVAQKLEMKRITELLNANVKGLNLSYDEENDKLNQSIDIIKKKIEAYKTLAKAEAYKETSKDLLKEQFKLEQEQTDLIEKQSSLREKIANATKFGNYDELQRYTQELSNIEGELKQVSEGIEDTSKKAEKMGSMQYFSELSAQAIEAGIIIPKALEDGIKGGYIKVPQSMEELNKLVDSKLGELLAYAKNSGIEIPKDLSQGIKDGSVSVDVATQRLTSLIENKLNIDTTELGRQITAGLERGMLLGEASLDRSVKRITDKVFNIMNKVSEVHSPSRRSMKLGKYIGQGLEEGLNKGNSRVEKAGQRLADKAFGQAKIMSNSLNGFSGNMNANLQNTMFYQNNIDYIRMGNAFISAIKNLDLGINLNGRELARGLEGIGVKFG